MPSSRLHLSLHGLERVLSYNLIIASLDPYRRPDKVFPFDLRLCDSGRRLEDVQYEGELRALPDANGNPLIKGWFGLACRIDALDETKDR